MKKNSLKYIYLFVFLSSSFLGLSQKKEDFDLKYLNAKDSFEKKNFSESIVFFDELTIPDNNNVYTEYAKYYKSYSYIKLKKYADARFILVKLIEENAGWDKINEAKYLLAYSQLLDQKYIEANSTISTIKNEYIKNSAFKMLYHFYANEVNLEIAKQTQLKLKKDQTLATILAYKLNHNSDSSNISLQKYLIQDYKLDPTLFGLKFKGKKDLYTVALLLPFSIDNPRAYLNTPSLNIRDGVQFAIDSLKSIGVNIKLLIYDTDKDTSRVKNILASEEFKNVDLIIGPVSGQSSIEVAKFANKNQIPNFNFSREKEVFDLGKYVFSTRTSYLNIGKQLAIDSRKMFDTTKSVSIYFHSNISNKHDSLIALTYKNQLKAKGMKIQDFIGVKNDVKDFNTSLSKINEENTSHVAVFASDNSIMASSLISVWESEQKTVPVLAPKEWLDIQLINYDQFFRKNIHFIFQDYILTNEGFLKSIAQKHINLYGVKPINFNYLAMGYDAMWFTGELFSKYGTNFPSELKTLDYTPLPFTAGVDFNGANSNCIIPVVKFDENYNFIWVNDPKTYNEETK